MPTRLRSLAAGRPGGGSGRAAAATGPGRTRPEAPPAAGGADTFEGGMRETPPAAPPAPGGADTFEWRMREADGPTDLGHYACACGFQFSARVETAVRCPHCGAGQAW